MEPPLNLVRVGVDRSEIVYDLFASVSWFNPSQQLSTMQPLPPSPSQWGEEEERGKKKKVKLVGGDKNSLIIKVKYNTNNSNNEI